uniref:DUF541 domain-containing protein n=1 Tax=Chromera velia CCMP2878 TaxID=1169474 RepID=A0A0G4FKD3_9ALVE|eukprot:Cvel_3459.t1-p1 / transcript=Cvel_3459.t1 / gene=Cvel_3459 / organism=Chromera_velia_CCMP2878 / gene_product=hypothetical protein / transcript_product=hypothetical protein / location=Cvel_scaffold139:78464-79225(+) / protein_length=254 / sequence_SO=supercontig / SO=protein_coding / is_pseudo=false
MLFGTPVQSSSVLRTSGEGKHSIPASECRVYIGFEASKPVATDAQKEVASNVEKVCTLLKTLPDVKAKTGSISIHPVHSRDDRHNRGNSMFGGGDRGADTLPSLIGYTASTCMTIRLPPSQMGKTIDELLKLGLSRVDRIEHLASDEEMRDARTEALKKAAKDARDQAEAVADAMGVSISPLPQEVQIQSSGLRHPGIYGQNALFSQQQMPMVAAQGGGMGGETQILEGQIVVTANVSVVYDLVQSTEAPMAEA